MKKNLNVLNDCRNMYDGEIIDTILQSREIKNKEEFLNPKLEDWLLPTSDLKNMDKAVNIVLDGLKRGDSFGVYADVPWI